MPPARSVLTVLAHGLAATRIGFGAQMLVRPQDAAGLSWVSRRQARKPVVKLFARGHGARDVGIGAGALWALRSGQDPRPWMAAQAAGDAADLIATLASRGDVPKRRGRFAMGVAAASLAVAAAGAAGLRPGD